MTEVFQRTPEQRDRALQLANQVRLHRAQLKKEIRTHAGRYGVARILRDPPDWATNMRVYELLTSMPGWGATKTRKLLRQLRISDHKKIGGLSGRQRDTLANHLENTTT